MLLENCNPVEIKFIKQDCIDNRSLEFRLHIVCFTGMFLDFNVRQSFPGFIIRFVRYIYIRYIDIPEQLDMEELNI